MPQPKSQADRRRFQRFRDQHQRRWGAVVEKETGDPCGPITPDGWAPADPRLLPMPAHIKLVPGELGQLVIDYGDWELSVRAAQKDYQERLETMAQSMYPEDKVMAAIADPQPALLRLVGFEKPPAWQPIRAMQRGHPWALFGRGERPAWADLYLPSLRLSTVHEEKFLEEDESFTPEERARAEQIADERLKRTAAKAAESITDETEPCYYCGKNATSTAIVAGEPQPVCKDHLLVTDKRDADLDDLDDEHDAEGVGGHVVPVRRAPNRTVKKATRPARA